MSKHLENARASIERGDTVGAEKSCTLALRSDSSNAEAYHLRAVVRLQLGEFVYAAQDATQALNNGDSSTRVFRVRATARYQQNQWAAAIEDCNIVLEADPDDADVWSMRGFARGQILDTQGALEDCSRAILLNPKDGGAWRVCGAAKLELGDVQGGISDLSESVRLNPKDARATMLLEMAESQVSPRPILESESEGKASGNMVSVLSGMDNSLGGLEALMDDLRAREEHDTIAFRKKMKCCNLGAPNCDALTCEVFFASGTNCKVLVDAPVPRMIVCTSQLPLLDFEPTNNPYAM